MLSFIHWIRVIKMGCCECVDLWSEMLLHSRASSLGAMGHHIDPLLWIH